MNALLVPGMHRTARINEGDLEVVATVGLLHLETKEGIICDSRREGKYAATALADREWRLHRRDRVWSRG